VDLNKLLYNTKYSKTNCFEWFKHRKRDSKLATILFCCKSISILNQWFLNTISIDFPTLFAKS